MKYLNELIGTFFLMLTVGLTVINPDVGLFAPLAIGSVLAVFVYAGGHISGGHYNPAVSLAVFIRKRLSASDLVGYWIAQLIGGALAAYAVLYFKGHGAEVPLVLDTPKALLAEFIFTFALCHVVLHTATVKATAGNSYFGWAIGFTVLVGAYAVGTISGGAFNPAVALGIALLHLTQWTNLWIYFAANLLGAVVAGVLFKAFHPQE